MQRNGGGGEGGEGDRSWGRGGIDDVNAAVDWITDLQVELWLLHIQLLLG